MYNKQKIIYCDNDDYIKAQFYSLPVVVNFEKGY